MTEQDFDNLEKYISGQLGPPEKSAFEQRLELEPDLREQAKVFKDLHHGIKQYGRQDLRKHIFPPARIPFMVRISTVWKVAIPAVIVTLILIYRAFTPSPNEQLFLAYYTPADTIRFSAPRGESEDFNIKLDALRDFKAGHYAASLSGLEKIAGQDPESDLLKGLDFIQLREFPEATLNLLKAKKGKQAISNMASWYLALAYIRQGETTNALAELKVLVGVESEFREKAKKLILKVGGK